MADMQVCWLYAARRKSPRNSAKFTETFLNQAIHGKFTAQIHGRIAFAITYVLNYVLNQSLICAQKSGF